MIHYQTLIKGSHQCPRLQKDFDRLGKEAFMYEVIVSTDDEILLQIHEKLQIDRLTERDYNIKSVNIRRSARMEPLNEIGTNEWIYEMGGYIDRIRPVKNEEGSNE